VPVLRSAAGPGRAHLRPRQRLPPGAQLTGRRRGRRLPSDPDLPASVDLADPALPRILAEGELELLGRITASSNATFLCAAAADGLAVTCVYKPVRGERPLWDFPDGTLAGREVATYLLSEALGWGIVPPTLLRDGPFGPGMVQAWVHAPDPDRAPERAPGPGPDAVPGPAQGPVDLVPVGALPPGYLGVLQAWDATGDEVVLVHADDPGLRRMAVLDVVANNADRKGGHVLSPAGGGQLRGCDHGLTFHVEPKLRTVLWGFAGRRLRAAEREPLERVAAQLAPGAKLANTLRGLVSPAEVAAARRRATALLRTGRFPEPSASRSAIPWPAF